MSPATTTAVQIADDAIEFMRNGHEQLKWLMALMRAIQLDAQHNESRGSIDLRCACNVGNTAARCSQRPKTQK